MASQMAGGASLMTRSLAFPVQDCSSFLPVTPRAPLWRRGVHPVLLMSGVATWHLDQWDVEGLMSAASELQLPELPRLSATSSLPSLYVRDACRHKAGSGMRSENSHSQPVGKACV